MDDEEFASLEAQIRELVTSIGAPELTDDRFYRRRDGREGREYLLPPRERVLAQLEAIDRYFSLYDRRVYVETMSVIRDLLSDGAEAPDLPIRAAIVVPDRVGGLAEGTVDLAELPDLAELRAQLRALVDRLSDA
jgi:hypothetical protein